MKMKKKTLTVITITVGPYDTDDGFCDYLIGEISNAIESTDTDGIHVTVTDETESV